MRIQIIATLLILIFTSKFSFGQEGIRFSDGSLNAILSIAKDRNKNVFIDTYADWCQPCKRMEKKFKNKDVARFYNEHFINYRVNMQNPIKANQLRKRYDIVFLPTMIIVDPEGVVKYQVDRELTVSELLNIGQKSLDPSSYHISESTAIRRNSTPVTTTNKSVAQPNKNENEATVAKTSKPPVESKTSTSAATQRAKLLDSYETVEESSEKVLAVLGAGELPPEVLYQEAYLRLEFMDGSHRQAAKKYLETQENWDSDKNRKFILDFVNSSNSKEYEYIIDNKDKFYNQLGKKIVDNTLEIITYRALHNAVPRPSLEESIQLFKDLGVKEPNRQGHNYYITRLIAEDKISDILDHGNRYLKSSPNDHDLQYTIAYYLTFRNEKTESNLQKARELIEKANTSNPNSLIYLDLLGEIYTKLGKTKKARKTYLEAIKVAKEQNKEFKAIEDKAAALNNN